MMTGGMIMEDINIQRHKCTLRQNIKGGCLKESNEWWLDDR